MDVEIANLTGALAAINVAGPERARGDAARLRRRLLGRGLRLSRRQARHASPACRRSRSGSASSASSATSSTSRARSPSTSGTRCFEQAADLDPKPFGLEPQRILRLEKGHVIVEPGHRLRVEPARGGDAVDRQERQGVRLGRQVGDRAGRRARPRVDARRLREPDRGDPGRRRPGRRRRQVVGPGHERPPRAPSSAR